jgi:LAO/AO transport system kinase
LDTLLEQRAQEQTASVGASQSLSKGGSSAMSAHASLSPLRSFRIGLAGPPGAGKSTLIEALGTYLIDQGHKVAVIAVDPSSSRTGGSILGDKTRMPELSRSPRAFVRPSPTRGALGGLARQTNDVVLLCEGAGFDIVLVETVGLGQSEVAVDSAVDMLLLVVPPANGDELQGAKKGIVEVADAVVVNKADGAFEAAARHAAVEYRRALQLVRWKHGMAWEPRVARCSALHGTSIGEVWAVCREFRQALSATGALQQRRMQQNAEWMWSQLEASLVLQARTDAAVRRAAEQVGPLVTTGLMTPRRAAHDLLTAFLDSCKAGGSNNGPAR